MDRKEAYTAGATRYDTGKPCKYGHLAPRYTKSGVCIICMRENVKRSNKTYATMGDMINNNSKLVYLFVKEENLYLIKNNVDALNEISFPQINPDFINNYPFKAVRQAERHRVPGVVKIRVRVPLAHADTMLAIGSMLLS